MNKVPLRAHALAVTLIVGIIVAVLNPSGKIASILWFLAVGLLFFVVLELVLRHYKWQKPTTPEELKRIELMKHRLWLLALLLLLVAYFVYEFLRNV